jgi:hypothetical protein
MVKEKIVHPLKNVCHEKIDKKYIELFFLCVSMMEKLHSL